MSRWLDAAMVASVLAASVGYALYSLGPKALRRWLRTALADLAGSLRLDGIERRLRAAAGGGACGGCDSCAPTAAQTPQGTEIKEIRVPAASIGKRRVN